MSRVLDAFNELRDNVQGKPWFEITEIAGRRHCAADWEAGARPLSGGRSRSYLDATRVGCGLIADVPQRFGVPEVTPKYVVRRPVLAIFQ
jgi:hypothetical protein